MFCRELFGKKPKTLDFGLQPHKIPDCDVVSGTLCLLSIVKSFTCPWLTGLFALLPGRLST